MPILPSTSAPFTLPVASPPPAAGKSRPSDPGEPAAIVEISPEARRAAQNRAGVPEAASQELAREEQQEVVELQRREQEVRIHEQAHQSAGGQYAGAASYSYRVGPDGRRYAVEGSVPIDTAPVPDDPGATIQKMQQVRRAALAPAQPSAADRGIAARAAQEEQKARTELTQGEDVEPEEQKPGNTEAFRSHQAATAYGRPQLLYLTEPEESELSRYA
ncbi:MAG: putative metalloprotease CJM1_0395 family protein [Planctomycetota bacterium]